MTALDPESYFGKYREVHPNYINDRKLKQGNTTLYNAIQFNYTSSKMIIKLGQHSKLTITVFMNGRFIAGLLYYTALVCGSVCLIKSILTFTNHD